MKMDDARIRAVWAPWYGAVEVLIEGGDNIVVDLVTEKRPEKGELIIEPTLRMERNNAQALFDDLWQCGFRPSEGQASVGQIESIKSHLEDMRKIAFKFLELK